MLGFLRCFVCKRWTWRWWLVHIEEREAVKHCERPACKERCAPCSMEIEGEKNDRYMG